MAISTCRECRGRVSTEAPFCPHCGAPDPTRTGRAAPQAGAPAPGSDTGCFQAGCLILALFFIVLALAGTCSDGGSSASSSYDGSTYSGASSASSSTGSVGSTGLSSPGETVTLYVHGSLNVRSGPGKNYPTVRTLSRGDVIRVGPKDSRGWARLEFSYGGTEGYVYRASDLVRTSPPSARPRAAYRAPDRDVNPTGATARCRDGTLSYSANRRGTCSHHGGVAVWF